MNLKIGIVGLPNVGKSTFFNALTKLKAETANYPFCTIEPNNGVIKVNDKRIEKLVNIFNPLKVSYTSVEFIDIAGLIKGASKGEGLGNNFLNHIRQCNVICYLVRCFNGDHIQHINNNISPIEDFEIVLIELILDDCNNIEKRMIKINKNIKKQDPTAILEKNVLEKCLIQLKNNKMIRNLKLSKEEIEFVKPLNLLTFKPFMIVGNISESDILNINDNSWVNDLKQYCNKNQWEVLFVSALFEQSLNSINEEEKKILFSEYNDTKAYSLDNVVKKAYQLLGFKNIFYCW